MDEAEKQAIIKRVGRGELTLLEGQELIFGPRHSATGDPYDELEARREKNRRTRELRIEELQTTMRITRADAEYLADSESKQTPEGGSKMKSSMVGGDEAAKKALATQLDEQAARAKAQAEENERGRQLVADRARAAAGMPPKDRAS